MRKNLPRAGMPLKKSIFSFLLFLLFTFAAHAQTVSGIVTDGNNQPVQGVTVKVKNSSRATSTDNAGMYKINASAKDVLVFSSVGFATSEVVVGNRTSIPVNLSASTQNLNEVVVTALGIRRETRRLGYATGTVNTEQITTNRTTNFGNSLIGKVSGVNVSPPAGGPGGSSKIRIRGQSSFRGDNSPLIVVNGIPINNSSISGGPSGQSGNPTPGSSDQGDGLQSINQDDIESMTVLKGAPAAALYGSRAKDGVIIITTKSGKGTTGIGVEINSNFQAEQALDFTDFQYQYGQGENGKRPPLLPKHKVRVCIVLG